MSKTSIRSSSKAPGILLILGILLSLGAATAWAGERAETRRRQRGLKAAGLRVYWSLLRKDQKAPAKVILRDFLVTTQPDRLQAFARLVRLKADVSAVLTEEQRLAGWAARRTFRALPDPERRAVVDRLLDGTDRAVLADRVEQGKEATPEQRVDLGIQILGQIGDVLEVEMTERLGLSDEQRVSIRTLYDAALAELRPVAVRLAAARTMAVESALGLLDEDQRAKVVLWHDDVRAKVLAFLRG